QAWLWKLCGIWHSEGDSTPMRHGTPNAAARSTPSRKGDYTHERNGAGIFPEGATNRRRRDAGEVGEGHRAGPGPERQHGQGLSQGDLSQGDGSFGAGADAEAAAGKPAGAPSRPRAGAGAALGPGAGGGIERGRGPGATDSGGAAVHAGAAGGLRALDLSFGRAVPGAGAAGGAAAG